MRGRDLFSEDAPDSRDLVGELHPDPLFAAHVQHREPRLVITRWPRKLILGRDGHVQQFDLTSDPGERDGTAGAPSRELEARARALAAELDGDAPPGLADPVAPVDTRSVEGLRALGYIE